MVSAKLQATSIEIELRRIHAVQCGKAADTMVPPFQSRADGRLHKRAYPDSPSSESAASFDPQGETESLNKRAYAAGSPTGIFGMLFGNYGIVPYNSGDSTTWMLPDCIQPNQPSKMLQDTTRNFIIAQEELGLWRTLVPIVEFSPEDQAYAVWTSIEYLATYAPQMPAMGVPTYVQSRRRQGRAVLVRHAIAASISNDALHTVRGTRHWLNSLNQVAAGVVSTSQLGAAILITRAPEAYLAQLRAEKRDVPYTIDEEMNYLAATFGLMQMPDATGFSRLRMILEKRYEERGNDPSLPRAIVMSNTSFDNLVHNNVDAIRYSTIGQDGPENLKRQSTIGYTEYLKTPLYLLRPFIVADGEIFQPMKRFVEVGEYYKMYNSVGSVKSTAAYSSIQRSIQVYTHARQWTPFTLTQAIETCVNWSAEDGTPQATGDGGSCWFEHAFGNKNGNGRAEKFGETWWWEKFWASPVAQTGPFVDDNGKNEALRAGLAEEPITLSNLRSLVNKNAPLPLNFVLAWPHMRWQADDAVLAVPGEFAKRLIKPVCVSIADNIQSRTHELIAEFEFGTAITNAHLCIEARAVYLTRYLGGMEANPIKKLSEDGDGYNPQAWKYNGDYISIVLPGHYDDTPANLNLAGHLGGCLTRRFRNVQDASGRNPNTYPGYRYYDSWYGFSGDVKAHARDHRTVEDEAIELVEHDCPVNCMCRPGTQRHWDVVNGGYNKIDWGNGYFKMGMTYNGCRDDRVGGTYKTHYNELNLSTV